MSTRPPVRLGRRKPGLTARQAAELVGRSPRTIRRWTSEPREDYLARVEERRQKARQLRATGMTLQAIANELGCSTPTVCRYIKSPHETH